MDRVVKAFLNDFIKSQEITEVKEDKQFELFSSYCVANQENLDNVNLMDIMTGDGNDCGIDSIMIMANGVLLKTPEEVEDIIELNGRLYDIKYIFVQAKTSSTFDGGDIGTFGAGVRDFFSDTPGMIRNDKIKQAVHVSNKIFEKAIYWIDNPVCKMYYVTNGNWMDDQNLLGRIRNIKEDLQHLNLFSDVKFTPVDAMKIQLFYRNTVESIVKEIEFSKRVSLPEIKGVNQAFIGFLQFNEFIKLLENDDGEILHSVFYDNVRDFQGMGNIVNNAIGDTIIKEPQNFVLFNNGITIICNSLKSVGDKVKIERYQIVNGCQTSHVLYENRYNIQRDFNIQIPVKMVETQNDEVINKIIRSNNSQTPVTDAELISLNKFNKKLEDLYNSFSDDKRLYYERRSKQYSYDKKIEKVRIVSVSTQIKAFSAMFNDKPHLASRYFGRLLTTDKTLFKDTHKLLPYFTSAYLLYRIDYMIRNKSIDSKYNKYRFHILMLIKYHVLAGNEVPALSSNKIEKLCENILLLAEDNASLYDEINIITSVIDKVIGNYNDQELTKSALIVDSLKQEFTQDVSNFKD